MPSPPEAAPASSLQVIAMHGWAGDGLGWDLLRQALAAPDWHWQCGERGYGGRTPDHPQWAPGGRRLLIGHSMGPHLLPPSLLEQAEKLEQLRALHLGAAIQVLETESAGVGVDTPEDVPRAEAALRKAGRAE